MLSAWLALFAAITANSIGNLLIKAFSQKTSDVSLIAYLSPWFVIGALFFGLNLVFYGKALRDLPQNVAYPVLVGASVLCVMISSMIFFSERVSITSMIGGTMIVVGIVLLAQAS